MAFRRALVLVFLGCGVLQSQESGIHLVPSEAMVRISEPRRFVIIDGQGQAFKQDVTWNAPASGELTVGEDGIATVVFRQLGDQMVTASINGQTIGAKVTVVAEDENLSDFVVWDFAPLGGRITQAMHLPPALPPESTEIVYEDSGARGSFIRGFDGDGIQRWAWPSNPDERAELMAGSNSGGVLAFVRSSEGNAVVRLSGDGKELWRREFLKSRSLRGMESSSIS